MSDAKKSAKEALFYATAEHYDAFKTTIGFSTYEVNIPHYEYDGFHYIPTAEMKKLEPVIMAFDKDEFLRPGTFLEGLAKSKSKSLDTFFNSLDWHAEYGCKKFLNSAAPGSNFIGIWPAVKILAAAAHHLQLDLDGEMTPEEKQFWRQHVGCVENKLGMADTLKATKRARIYGDKLTTKIIIPEIVSPEPLPSRQRNTGDKPGSDI